MEAYNEKRAKKTEKQKKQREGEIVLSGRNGKMDILVWKK